MGERPPLIWAETPRCVRGIETPLTMAPSPDLSPMEDSMNVKLPLGAKLVKAYYVLLPYQGASETAGQAVYNTETDRVEDFVDVRNLAVIQYWQNLAFAKKNEQIVTDENSRPVIVHRFYFEYPINGAIDVELERQALTDEMIEVAKETTLHVTQETISMLVERTQFVFTDQGGYRI